MVCPESHERLHVERKLRRQVAFKQAVLSMKSGLYTYMKENLRTSKIFKIGIPQITNYRDFNLEMVHSTVFFLKCFSGMG